MNAQNAGGWTHKARTEARYTPKNFYVDFGGRTVLQTRLAAFVAHDRAQEARATS